MSEKIVYYEFSKLIIMAGKIYGSLNYKILVQLHYMTAWAAFLSSNIIIYAKNALN